MPFHQLVPARGYPRPCARCCACLWLAGASRATAKPRSSLPPLVQVATALSRRHLASADAGGRELLAAAGFTCPRKGNIAVDGKCPK